MSFWITVFLSLDAQEQLHAGQRPLHPCFIQRHPGVAPSVNAGAVPGGPRVAKVQRSVRVGRGPPRRPGSLTDVAIQFLLSACPVPEPRADGPWPWGGNVCGSQLSKADGVERTLTKTCPPWQP